MFPTRFIATVILLAGFSGASQALVVSPDVCAANPSHCQTSGTQGGNDDSVFPELASLDLLYKYETGASGEDGSALLAASYSSSITTEAMGDYLSATISYDSGDKVDCSSPCYLVVKDGDHDPARFMFNLILGGPLGWDGMEDLVLENFWPGSGSISHFAIYGSASPVPLPAAVWLFGSALIGFIGFARRIHV